MKKMLYAVLLTLVTVALGCSSTGTKSDSPEDGPYLLLLGSAQDGGLPQIGCEEDLCQDAIVDPSRRRLVSSLLICDPVQGKRWLVDATPDIRDQVQLARGHPPTRRISGHRPPLFEGIFLTHAHTGHYTGLLHLGRESYGARELPVHASRRMCSFLENNGPWDLMVKGRMIELHTMEPDKPVRLTTGIQVTPVPVPHREEYSDTMAFVIRGPRRSVLFLPDIDKWDRWDRRLEDVLEDVDLALVDGTFFADGEIPGRSMAEIPHPFISETIRRLENQPPAVRRKIIFTHLNHTNPATDPDSPAAKSVQRAGMQVAREGMVIRL